MHSKIKKQGILRFSAELSAIIFSLFIWFFLPQKLNAQNENPLPFVLSERIGADLDSNEIEYFNIFPDINKVKGAVYRLDNFENLRMLLSLADGRDTTITFSKLGALELRKYIDKHELLPDSQNIVNWELLPGYSLWKMNFFEDHGSILYVKCDTVTYSGKLLKIEDDHLILWASTQPFRPGTWTTYSKKIPAGSITRIERKQDLTGKIFGITMGAGIGAAFFALIYGNFDFESLSLQNTVLLIGGGGVIGGGLGWLYDGLTISRRKYNIQNDRAKYLKAKKKLEKRAIFSSVFPPELKNL